MRLQVEPVCVSVDCVSSEHPHHPYPHESCCEQVSSAQGRVAQDCLSQSGGIEGGSIHRDAGGFEGTSQRHEQEGQTGVNNLSREVFNSQSLNHEDRSEIETGQQKQHNQEHQNNQERENPRQGDPSQDLGRCQTR